MDAGTASFDNQSLRGQVELEYEELARHRVGILNRELVRLRQDGWDAQMIGDQIVASRREGGRSHMERTLLAVGALLAVAYVATIAAPRQIEGLPISELELMAAAAALGLAAALLTSKQAARQRHITVGVDGQGRPVVTDHGAGR